MSKKFIYLVSFVLVLGLASITYGIQLGDFENNMDGWVRNDPNDANISLSYSTTGATLGSYSLKIADPNGSRLTIMYSLIDNNKVDAFRKNLKVSADVTRLTTEWTEVEGSYCDFMLAINAGSSADPCWTSWYQSSEGGTWHPYDGDDTKSFTYDYSLALNRIDFNNLEYLQFVFVTNYGAFSAGGIYYLDNVQMFGGGPAYAPHPTVGEIGVRRDIILSWTPGAYAKKHDVYFDTDFSKVTDANRTNTLGVLVNKDQTATTYDPPGFLKSSTTYYWRIDEVNEAGPDPCFWKGDVWSFTTPYPGGVILGDWEKNMDGWKKGTQGNPTFDYNDIRGVTLNNYSLTVSTGTGFWTFQRPGWVDLTNMTLFLDVTMIASEWPGGQWTKVDKLAVSSDLTPGWREFNPTAIDRTTGKSAPLDWGNWNGDAYKTYSWDLSSYSDWANATQITINIALQTNITDPSIRGPFHLDNARLLDTRIASNPKPTDYATEVWIDPNLGWKPGKYAAKHDVYFGTDLDKVTDANRTNTLDVLVSKNQVLNNYKPGTLEFDTTYYWRIDEVNDARAPYIWKGHVWAFMTGHYLIVDDFEDYNETSPHIIWENWIDGWGVVIPPIPGNGTGSIVGYSVAGSPYAETRAAFVHSGAQSMPMDYNNVKTPYYSETDRTWATPQDWTVKGVKSLTLWYRGYRASVGSFTEFPLGTYTITAAGADIWDVAAQRGPWFHDEFHYAYKQITVSGPVTIIAKVENVDNTDVWAKAGLMVRDSLDADSPHVMMCITPGQGVAFQYRYWVGGPSTNAAQQTGITAPQWLKLEYDTTTSVARASYSADGQTWTDLGTQQYVSMTDPIYIGLSLTAHNVNATCTARYSNVSITGAAGAWSSKDIGIKSNVPEPMYVALQSGLNTAVVQHETDPNAVLQGTWQEWNIDLKSFTGINLNAVQRMIIGTGKRGAPQPGSAGTVYFDDIRLYVPRCMPLLRKPAADLNSDCVVDYADLDVMVDEWLNTVPPETALATDLNGDNKVDLKDYAVLAQHWLEEVLWP